MFHDLLASISPVVLCLYTRGSCTNKPQTLDPSISSTCLLRWCWNNLLRYPSLGWLVGMDHNQLVLLRLSQNWTFIFIVPVRSWDQFIMNNGILRLESWTERCRELMRGYRCGTQSGYSLDTVSTFDPRFCDEFAKSIKVTSNRILYYHSSDKTL